MIWDSELGVPKRSPMKLGFVLRARSALFTMPELPSRFSNALLLIQKSMQEVYVHTLTRTWQAIAVAAAIGAFVATAGLAQNPPAAQPQGQQPAAAAKKVKDQGEYDIFNEALKDAANPQKEVQDLDTWVQKYPESDYKWDRLYMYMQAYGKM